MSGYDDYFQQIRNQQQMSALQGLFGTVGGGLAGYNPNPPVAVPNVVPPEPEFPLFLLTGDDE